MNVKRYMVTNTGDLEEHPEGMVVSADDYNALAYRLDQAEKELRLYRDQFGLVDVTAVEKDVVNPADDFAGPYEPLQYPWTSVTFVPGAKITVERNVADVPQYPTGPNVKAPE